jgi:hypothetical protein
VNSSQTEYLNDKATHQPDDTIKEESEVQLKIIKPQEAVEGGIESSNSVKGSN